MTHTIEIIAKNIHNGGGYKVEPIWITNHINLANMH
jgi:hypothetical protein